MLAMRYDNRAQRADLARHGNLIEDDGLETAVVISLFTDRRAGPDDDISGRLGDRRGWWGDMFPAKPGDLVGSRLWLLQRAKATAHTLARAREYCTEALGWMLDDGVASAVAVKTAWSWTPAGEPILEVAVEIALPAGGIWAGAWRRRLDAL